MTEFEWDENKNRKDRKKHGIGFEEAKGVFRDPKRITFKDQRRNYGEERWKTIGTIFGVIISVIYTIRETATRLISARKANAKERDEYSNQ